SLMLSFKTSFLPAVAYFNIQLSCPPEAYRNFPSAVNFKPYQAFLISTVDNTLSLTASMSCNECLLCPLLVTAIIFLFGEIAIFNGRSPNGRLLPTGVRLQPLGRPIRFDSSC